MLLGRTSKRANPGLLWLLFQGSSSLSGGMPWVSWNISVSAQTPPDEVGAATKEGSIELGFSRCLLSGIASTASTPGRVLPGADSHFLLVT